MHWLFFDKYHRQNDDACNVKQNSIADCRSLSTCIVQLDQCNICPNSPKKKDNLRCVKDIELKVLTLIPGNKTWNM